ncbi:hypothetical protein C4F40_16355 [Sphingobacterium sp. Ka21]|uniref:Uncharacterized protein n=2 Tax=Sphingobacterium pedocola TaxID=2082722 RepID=A0ABR9TAD5_9SPHI|nr:hypothetical protein [Sphingobacterium pedocola]
MHFIMAQEQKKHLGQNIRDMRIIYFKEELIKEHDEKQELKDEIAALKTELEALKGGSPQTKDNIKNIGRKAE